MSARENMSASPFIISKSILKHPIREIKATPYSQQTKHKNLRLFINKKHSELQALHGLSSRNHAIVFISGQLGDQSKLEQQASKESYKPINFKRDLDSVSKRVYEHIQGNMESLPAIQKYKLKKGKPLTRDQRLRAHVYGSIGPEVVGKLYDRYTEKRKEYEISRLKDAETVNVRKLIGMTSKPNDKPEDYFVVQTLQQQGFNAAQLLNVGDLKTKEIEVESPKDEGDKELDEIVERHQERSKDKKLYVKRKEEERQVIELSNIGSAVTKHSSQAQIHRFNGYFKDVEAVYTMQENRMKEAREEQLKQSSARFVRQDESVAGKIEEKARANLARLFKEHKDLDKSNSNSTSINNSGTFSRFSNNNIKSRENFSVSINKNKPILPVIEKPSITSLSEANFRLKSENETKSLIQVYYEGSTARSKSMPKVAHNIVSPPGIASPILVEASDSSFGHASKIFPYGRESPIHPPEDSNNKINTSKETFEKIQRTAADTPELQYIDEKVSNIFQHSLVFHEFPSPCLSAARSASNERLLVSKRSMPAINLSSVRGANSHRGSISSGAVKKLLKPLDEVKQKLQAFHDNSEGFFVHSEQDHKFLVENISKARKDLEKEYKQIQKSTTRGLGMNSEEMIEFTNKQNFKKEVVSKIVASIENKEEALHAIQKKRYLAEMNIKVAKAMEF